MGASSTLLMVSHGHCLLCLLFSAVRFIYIKTFNSFDSFRIKSQNLSSLSLSLRLLFWWIVDSHLKFLSISSPSLTPTRTGTLFLWCASRGSRQSGELGNVSLSETATRLVLSRLRGGSRRWGLWRLKGNLTSPTTTWFLTVGVAMLGRGLRLWRRGDRFLKRSGWRGWWWLMSAWRRSLLRLEILKHLCWLLVRVSPLMVLQPLHQLAGSVPNKTQQGKLYLLRLNGILC